LAIREPEQINYLSTGVALEAWRADERVGIVSAERRQYLDSAQRPIGEPHAVPGIRSSVAQDVYVLLDEVRGETAELRVSFRPIVSCVWIGCTLVVLGAVATAIQFALAGRTPGDVAHAPAG
jgi:cytochrome c biogenesis factor